MMAIGGGACEAGLLGVHLCVANSACASLDQRGPRYYRRLFCGGLWDRVKSGFCQDECRGGILGLGRGVVAEWGFRNCFRKGFHAELRS
jgi:hypothetical protein